MAGGEEMVREGMGMGMGVEDKAGGRVVVLARAGQGDEQQQELPRDEAADEGADGGLQPGWSWRRG